MYKCMNDVWQANFYDITVIIIEIDGSLYDK